MIIPRHVTTFFVPLGLLLAVCTSCKLDSNFLVSPTTVGPKNQPVVVSVADAFTFTVDAADFSYGTTQGVTFTGDSLVATLVVSNYASGAGHIESVGANGATFYSEVLNGNRNAVITAVAPSAPKSVSVSLNRYTGSVTFVLAKKK